ncbi:MAG: chemotaxis protein CheW [bacterium]|nr:chemotaxis protein CheW [bacterium]
MSDKTSEYKVLFLEESGEYVTALNENLVAIEKDKGNRRIIDNIFRVVHTLKSSAAAVGYPELSELSHKAEDLMQKIRNSELEITSDIIDAFFEFVDMVRVYLKDISENKVYKLNIEGMMKRFGCLIDSAGKEDKKEAAAVQPAADKPAEIKVVFSEYEKKMIKEAKKQERMIYCVTVSIDPREQMKWLRTELILNKLTEMGEMIKLVPDKDEILKPGYNGVFSVILSSAQKPENITGKIRVDLVKEVKISEVTDTETFTLVHDPDRGKDEARPEKKEYITKEDETNLLSQAKEYNIITSSDTIRVPVNKLDSLMNLVGELVITNSGLKKVESRIRGLFTENDVLSNEMNFVTDKVINIVSELQINVMNMRMLPIANVFNQFNRVVRDLSKEQNKQIDLVLKGEETELDKKVIDEIGAPLTHLVRNSIDHGIEKMDERLKKGKPVKGQIMMKAVHEGNHIIISVKDDGRGIDIEKVKETAVKKGLASRQDAENMSEEQLLKFIFKSGFSTKDEISTVSGRGVGLDVVHNVITALGGHVNIKTRKEEGTEFIIILPLTLAVTAGILVELNQSLYAIPITYIRECIKITKHEIKTIEGYMTVKLRDEILPLIDLHSLYDEGGLKIEEGKEILVIVVNYQNKAVGLVVDRIIGEQEIVLKPLEKHYKVIKGLSGAAILGDGKIVLIIDVVALVGLYREIEERKNGVSEVRAVDEVWDLEEVNQKGQMMKEKLDKKRKEIKKLEEDEGEKEDFVKKLVNTSFKDAALSLSHLTNEQMEIYATSIDLMSGEEMVNRIEENLEEPYCCSMMKTEGEINASMVFLISKEEAIRLYDILNEKKEGTTKEVDIDVTSAIGEINNIMSSAFINNLANLVDMKINPSVPMNSYDMLGALMQGVVMQEEFLNKKVYFANTRIKAKEDKEFVTRLMIMSDKDTLFQLIKKIKG